MISFSPRTHFQTFNKAEAEELHTHAQTRWFALSLGAALSEMAKQGATVEELGGASRFINIFVNLGEKSEPPLKFPDKRLTSYEPQEEPETPSKDKPK